MNNQNRPDSLNELMLFIGQRYTYTPEHYPALQDMSSDEHKAFAVSHSAHHMMKSLGKISAECEAFDHGGQMNHEVLREAVVKMLINTLKLAEELELNGNDLCEAVPRLMKSK